MANVSQQEAGEGPVLVGDRERTVESVLRVPQHANTEQQGLKDYSHDRAFIKLGIQTIFAIIKGEQFKNQIS